MENPILPLLAKTACESVVLEFFHALDTRRHEAAAALMAEDGVWHRQGRRLAGRAEILQVLNARAAERSTCHVITNLRLVELAGARATVGYFLTAYESVPHEQDGAPRLVAIRECQDVLVETDGGWRLADKSSRRHLPPE
ncbi:nuclear transport factor 2 family protein [Achromobacter xylosoxidans]|uniref:nuclear transport factor 2 family protein n=1 Tax=Alcaligenes xylosoxydans xylosoxydans TaxID=85698 RepID=UPI000B48E45A|nr:nuclear transport factor 2 family protein [Achromobacter xylosoxidans]